MDTKKKTRTKARKRKRPAPKPTVPLIRTSERSSFKRCRWQWDRNYNDRLQPREERPALRFGTLVHKALELRYPPGIKRGPKPAESFERLYNENLEEIETQWGFQADEEWTNALDIGVDMLEAYVEKYGRDEEWKVIASEATFKVPVLDDEDKLLFYYVGTMDGVWENRMDGGVRINDYKTTAGDPIKEAQGKGFLDEQATAYWTWGVDWLIAEKVLKPKQQQALDGMLYTFLRKAKRDPRSQNAQGQFLNKDGSVSQKQPLPMFHRELMYRSEADKEHARERVTQEFAEMQMVKRGELAVYKTPDTGSMGHCRWCQFNDICELHEAGADWEAMRDATMIEWDPYGAHEIAEEGKGR